MVTPSFYKLRDEHQESLRHQPETGMGYQLIQHGSDLVVASNGELLTKLGAEPSPIIIHPKRLVLAEPLEQFDASQVLLNPKFAGVIRPFSSTADPATSLPVDPLTVAALEPPFLYTTQPGDEFVRLSAFPNDKRLLKGGALAAGSYATTPSDLKVVPSGIAAVGRYALPNNLAACYVYRIIPPVGTKVYFGTVAPSTFTPPTTNYCGGGVEVLFPDELPEGSARLFKTIPMI